MKAENKRLVGYLMIILFFGGVFCAVSVSHGVERAIVAFAIGIFGTLFVSKAVDLISE